MKPKYLIRFDDVCPTMNWLVWEEIESVLLKFGVKPLLAVVPDNRDPKLVAGPPHLRFWDEVRKWQQWGWTIGLHGCHHEFVSSSRGLVGLHNRSEFAGLPREEQDLKLRRGVAIFRQEQIEPQVWVAPAHSFDSTTVELLHDLGIFTISDGFAVSPHRSSDGMCWIPQQLWKFRWRPFGVWTVCYHHNRWTSEMLEQFRRDVEQYHKNITAFSEVISTHEDRRRNWLDFFYGNTHRAVMALRN